MVPIEDIPVLDPAACADVRNRVHALRGHWVRRHPIFPFFTLGTAAYLDATRGPAPYVAGARRTNPVLREHFADLQAAVEAALALRLGGPVATTDPRARPGFHVYLAHPAFAQDLASIHFDTQYRLVPWDDAPPTSAAVWSFTLAIALPRAGAGLVLWDVDHSELPAVGRRPLREVLAERGRTVHEYRLGHLALHDGHTLHQAAPARAIHEGDERVTLQGHARPRAGGWEIYW